MAEQKIYIGSVGPYLYDDTDLIDDADSDFPGETYHGLCTSGQLIVDTAPSQLNHVVRVADIIVISPATTVVTELASGQVEDVGTSLNYAREDHTHGTPEGGGVDILEVQMFS